MDAGDAISEEALRFFASAPGVRLLRRAEDTSGNEFEVQARLRREYSAELARAAVALLQLRAAAHQRFEDANSMFFDREGLEMASRTEVARHRARRLCQGGQVADLCCGVGGDLLELARVGSVVGVERDRRRARMARMNGAVLGGAGVRVVVADVREWCPQADVLFVDPARRSAGGRRSRTGAAYFPPLEFATGLLREVPAVAVKVSPAIDEADLPPGWEIEFVSAGGQCREGVLYGGTLAGASRRATVLPGGDTLTSEPGPVVPVAAPGAYLFEPDPAVIRAHLVDVLARRLDAWKLDPQVAYLSAEGCAETPFARAFRVLSVQPFHLKRLRRYLRGEDLQPVEIKRRRFPMTPEALWRRLGRWEAARPVTLVMTRLGDRASCLICERVVG